jgi:purine-nucleoside phosphorylase
VHGHAGELHVGSLGGKTVICMKGRFHYYEGYAPSVVCLPVRVMAALGIKLLFVTNAAGGANPAYNVGDVMIMKDHVSFLGLAGIHPLRGFNDARFGPRFPALNDAYAKEHIALLKTCAADTKFAPGLHEGCYYGFSGPTYESPYEIELVRACKGDAVGMSTVFEVAGS